MIEAELDDLLSFAQAWSELAWAIQEQVMHVVNGTDDEHNVKVAAIQQAAETLKGYHEDLDFQLERWLKENA